MHGTSMGCLLVHLAMLCAVSAWNLPDESTMTGETTKESNGAPERRQLYDPRPGQSAFLSCDLDWSVFPPEP